MMGKEHNEVKNRAYPTWANELALNQRGKIIVPPSSRGRSAQPQTPVVNTHDFSNLNKFSNKIYGHTSRYFIIKQRTLQSAIGLYLTCIGFVLTRRSGTRFMSETLRSGEFIMVTNEFDNETARRQVSLSTTRACAESNC
jgi:hypothetical protein